MATYQAKSCISLNAAADLSAGQFHAVRLSAAKTVALGSTAGEPIIGILQNKPAAAGQAATVAFAGTTKAVAGAAVSAGAQLKVNASGRLVAAAAGTTNISDAGTASDPLIGSNVVGIALEAASGNGVVFEVLLTHSGAVPTTAA